MNWGSERHLEGGVSERDYNLTVAGRHVPGVLWMPIDKPGPVPLVLLGYGSGGHMRDGSRTWQGGWFARRGVAATSIDLPGHGERGVRTGVRLDYGLILDEIIEEWRACLDACVALPGIDAKRVAYRGQSMGTMLGLPFVASEPRIIAASLGLADLRDVPGRFTGSGSRLRADAARLACPVLFVLNWDDELVDRNSALDLFDTIGTTQKELRAYPGSHGSTPSAATEAGMQYLIDHLSG